MTSIMVDLETWGTRPGSALRSIGAVTFDLASGAVGDEFYANIDDASCESWGLTKDPATVQWWAEQSSEARDALAEAPQALPDALMRFANWWGEHAGTELWAYGPNFDEVLLGAAFKACSIAAPWTYKQPRCARTMLALAGVEIPRSKGVHHNAIDDARNQVAALHEAFTKLGLGRSPVDRGELTDLVSDAIGDSIDMDWTASIGARHVVDALIRERLIRTPEDGR